jgi:hypothetical protein
MAPSPYNLCACTAGEKSRMRDASGHARRAGAPNALPNPVAAAGGRTVPPNPVAPAPNGDAAVPNPVAGTAAPKAVGAAPKAVPAAGAVPNPVGTAPKAEPTAGAAPNGEAALAAVPNMLAGAAEWAGAPKPKPVPAAAAVVVPSPLVPHAPVAAGVPKPDRLGRAGAPNIELPNTPGVAAGAAAGAGAGPTGSSQQEMVSLDAMTGSNASLWMQQHAYRGRPPAPAPSRRTC